ncbi:hypothetical protein GCM10010168_01110 [Actinoplanes ianthinogenes]|uniref:Uncharacterized protein n=1 Tax=Actinoplanes ianthinogenes TaxID=122358 RepID=A0ABN6CC97_9ACTN|nr:hypothetical protein Aiant_38040 [Actinoplanes ianthinogenes]GGQ89884.1 hypothetical protein GCM10010168_01110 [Actinoplanes ianthinogenes]
MFLSPKSVFIGVIAIGLPFAVVVGWALGTPKARPVATAETGGTGGSDALGVAPPRAKQTDGHPARPADTAPTSPVVVVASTVVTKTVTVPASAPPVTAATSSPPPDLSMPPVPTPTQITGPPEPTPTPSESAPPSTGVTPTTSAPYAP